jgi:hypothetical protein
MTVKVQFVKDYIVYNGKDYKGIDALGKLCRELVTIGYGNEPLEAYRAEKLCITISNIAERAGQILQENDRGLYYRKYRPRPTSNNTCQAIGFTAGFPVGDPTSSPSLNS